VRILAIIIPNADRHGDSFIHLPLGMGYVLGNVRREFPNAEIKVLDFTLDRIFQENEVKERLLQEQAYAPDFVLYAGMITRYGYIKMLSRKLKEIFPRSVQIVGGSIAATGYKQLASRSFIDYFVVGEGESAVNDILRGQALTGLAGIVINKPYGTCSLLQSRERIRDLDTIEWPAYDLLRVEEYIAAYYQKTGWKYVPIIASRGCPFACNFCYRNFGQEVYFRSPASIVAELLFLKQQYGIDSFYMYDEVQFLNLIIPSAQKELYTENVSLV